MTTSYRGKERPSVSSTPEGEGSCHHRLKGAPPRGPATALRSLQPSKGDQPHEYLVARVATFRNNGLVGVWHYLSGGRAGTMDTDSKSSRTLPSLSTIQ